MSVSKGPSPGIEGDIPAAPHPPIGRGWLLGAAAAYLLFVVYGSLVPLAYEPMPWAEAISRFRDIPFLHLGIGSRADWVANLLLFIPLAYLWLGALWPRQGTGARPGISLLLWLALIGLACAIEFTQLFFPPRTVSQNDILAESLGALIGICLWWWTGPAVSRWLGQWRETRGATGVAERLLFVYLFVLFGYSLLPLDLTISPVEIYKKLQSGRVVLMPFTGYSSQGAELVYEVATDIALWMPVSLLWVISGRRTRLGAWGWAVFAAVLLEGLQLMVWSRVTDVTDILTAMAGAGLGAWLAPRRRIPATDQGDVLRHAEDRGDVRPPAAGFVLLGFVILVLGTLVALLVFWYPFDFVLEREFLRQRIQSLYQVPFRAYYYGTEFRAITSLIQRIVFFAPLGVGLALMATPLRERALRGLFHLLALLLLAGAALAVELGQVALPGKNADTTDWALEVIGAALGYAGGLWVMARLRPRHGPDVGDYPAAGAGASPTRHRRRRHSAHRKSARPGAP